MGTFEIQPKVMTTKPGKIVELEIKALEDENGFSQGTENKQAVDNSGD